MQFEPSQENIAGHPASSGDRETAGPPAVRPGRKVCRMCSKEKPRSEFYRSRKSADGLEPKCKPCREQPQRAPRCIEITVEDKLCRRCLEKKLATEFHPNARTADGLHSYCKTCKRQVDKDGRLKRKLGPKPPRCDEHLLSIVHHPCTQCGLYKPESQLNEEGQKGVCSACRIAPPAPLSAENSLHLLCEEGQI